MANKRGLFMTTRDAGNSAWQAVQLGKLPGLLVLLLAVVLTNGCATTGVAGNPNQAINATASTDGSDSSSDTPLPTKPASTSYVVKGKRYQVNHPDRGHEEKGTASWYGKRFHGRRTSSGERFDMHAMTAAHKNLPLASLIQVTNLENGRSAVVRVNDRGPFHGNRVLDLSYAAATELDMLDKGMAKVKIQVLETASSKLDAGLHEMFVAAADKARAEQPVSLGSSNTSIDNLASVSDFSLTKPPLSQDLPKVAESAAIYLQVGNFDNRTHAERLRQDLVAKLEETVLVRTDTANDLTPYMVQVGPLDSKDEASHLSHRLASLGVGNTKVVMR